MRKFKPSDTTDLSRQALVNKVEDLELQAYHREQEFEARLKWLQVKLDGPKKRGTLSSSVAAPEPK
jgi:hypothetical protein